MIPHIDRNIPTPIYQQLAEWMRDQIVREQWPEHYQLKAEEDLAKEWGVSRGTMRKALSSLMDEGLLKRIHGRGTFVSASVVVQPLAEKMVTFSEDLIQRGIQFETRVITHRNLEPLPYIASQLKIPEGGSVFYVERVRVVKSEPVILLQNYVNLELCPGIDEVDFTRYRLFETLEERYHLDLASGSRVFEAQLADENVTALLTLPPCSPVMHMQQITYLKDKRPIELSNLWLRADRYRISASVSRATAEQTTTRLEH